MSQEVSSITALTAGFLSFFAPCILPLIPPYFAWLLGVSQDGIGERSQRLRIVLHGVFLVLGFSAVFIILGASAGRLGQILAPHRLLAQKTGGLLIIFFGLEFAGALKIIKNRQALLAKKLFSKINHKTSSFLVGAVFAFAWVACFSPILGSILVLASFRQSLNQGVAFLSFYSLGLAIPFLLTSFFIGLIMEKMRFITRISQAINLFSGTVLVGLGFLLLTDNYYKIVVWLNKVYQ